MKILICNNTLSLLAGSETYTYTLAVELKRQGHDVHCYSKNLGHISDFLLKDHDIPSFSDVSHAVKDYALILANHRGPSTDLKDIAKKTKMIYTCHSIYGFNHDTHPENPVDFSNKYVAVSEEIQEIMQDDHDFKNVEVIRNGIDLYRFKEQKPRNKKIKRILFNSNYMNMQHPLFKALHDACNCLNIDMIVVGLKIGGQAWEMENAYNDVDAVFSLGRGCLEAMACNRPAFVFGHNGCDGLITKENYKDLRKKNYSGRITRRGWDCKRIIEEIQKIDEDFDYSELVQDNDIKKISKQYLNLAENE